MRFGLVRLVFKKSSKLNQTNAVRIGSVVAVYIITLQYQIILNIQKKNMKFQNNFTVPIKVVYPKQHYENYLIQNDL
jgi:hypothetical protein